MSCIEVLKHLYEFMDNELDISISPRIKKHIVQCSTCKQRYELEKNARGLIKSYCKNITAPQYLYKQIIVELNSVDLEFASEDIKKKHKVMRMLFSARTFAIAASVLLIISGGLFYYENKYYKGPSIVDDAIQNHVMAVNDNNLVLNEKTSVVNNTNKYNKYVNNSLSSNFRQPLGSLNTEQFRVVGDKPVELCGTSSSCILLHKGNKKLSLQIIHNNRFPTNKLERTRLGLKEFYVGNRSGFNSVIWREGGITYCLISDINKNEILRFAASLTSR